MTGALTVTGAVTVDDVAIGVRAVDGLITEIGPAVAAQEGDERLDAGGDLLLRGLVNGHTHAAMTLFRGYGGDLPLMQWLEDKIWPAEARLTDDDVYWGTRLACIEMARSGTTSFWDMYWRPVAVARAVRDAGMRATVGPPIVDGLDPTRAAAACAEAASWIDQLADFAPQVQPCLAPHGIYTVSEGALAWVAEESATRQVPVHLHFLETHDEVTGCLDRYGERPGALLERLGLLSERTLLAHVVWADDDDLARIGAHGATVVTNPVSNLKLAVGRVFPYARARAHGIPVALGTDGASSNNSLDLLADVKVLALLQKFGDHDPASLPAHEAWAVATGALAPALHAHAAADGSVDLQVGDPADFFLARRDAPELAPGHLLDNLVYAADKSVVRTTVVGGRVVMCDGVVADEAEVRAKVVECAHRLGVL
jgi:5-methylthioadenosine/S-adenosylhomocysteine deaminase